MEIDIEAEPIPLHFFHEIDQRVQKINRQIILLQNFVFKHTTENCRNDCLNGIPSLREIEEPKTSFLALKQIMLLKNQNLHMPVSNFELIGHFLAVSHKMVQNRAALIELCATHYSDREISAILQE